MSNEIKENKGYTRFNKHKRTKRILSAIGGVAAVSIAAGGITYGFLKDPAGTKVKIQGPDEIQAYEQNGETQKFNATDNYGRPITGE
jgi:hypothetical protein